MAIQTLMKEELDQVSGGLILDLNGLLGGLPAVGGLLTNIVGVVNSLLGTVTGLLQGLGLGLLIL